MSGFYLMHRGWRDKAIFGRTYSRAEAWLWLIENTCFKPTEYDIRGKTVIIERGQICASRDQLAKAWNWSGSAVERFLTRLKTEQMIGQETGQGKSVITICNYEKYQTIQSKTGQPTGQPTGQTSDRLRTAKEIREQGKERTIDKSIVDRARGSRLPKDFEIPPEWQQWAMDERHWRADEARAEAANFVDFWHGKAGKDAVKQDWHATWRVWIRNSRRTGLISNGYGPGHSGIPL